MLRGGVVAGGMAAFAAGYGGPWSRPSGPGAGTAGAPTHAVRGNSLTPEFRIDPVSGVLSAQPGQTVSPSSCLGCWTQCGVRLRVDARKTASCAWPAIRIIRWPPRARPPWRRRCARSTRNWAATTAEGRATSCARGSAMLEQLHSPYRVLQPLKRVGPRGAGKWQTISFEQLVQEVCGAATCSARAVMWTACARSTTARRRWIRPARSTAPRSTSVPVHRRVERGPHAADPALRGPVLRHGQFRQPRFILRTELPRGRGRSAGRPERHAARQSRIGTTRASACSSARRRPAGNPFQRQARQLAEARTRRRKRASSMWWCRPCCRPRPACRPVRAMNGCRSTRPATWRWRWA